ncbi:MAG: alpha/beta fold hydrolase [Candidatus Heimdallarchaeota archaeon]|nr:alpha/beta fold hydrolase [Candidatus Heimdallarchaeota archaeon]
MNTSQDELEYLKDDAKPFYFEGSSNKIGILLTHGFTASPTEMLPLGKYLHRKGFTVHGIQLAGHGTNYWELPNYSYKDWINSIDEGLSLLTEKCETIIPIGISMGAVLSLLLVHRNPDTNFKKIVLLAPAFELKSKLVKLTPFISLFKKFLYKGDDVLQYYKDHNLYAYYYYPTKAIAQLEKLRKSFNEIQFKIKIPTLISYGDLDDTISIAAIEPVIRTKFAHPDTVIVKSYPKSRHNFTTDPDAQDLFQGIYDFIRTENQ